MRSALPSPNVTKTRLLLTVAAVLVASSCASATQPALQVGSAQLSRAELVAAIEDVGVPVSNSIARASLGGGPGFDDGIQNVISDLFAQEVELEVEARGLQPTSDDVALAFQQRGLPPDADLSDLSANERSVIDVDVGIAVLDRVLVAEGSSIRDWITQLEQTVIIDPRYGSWVVGQGFVPPTVPGF